MSTATAWRRYWHWRDAGWMLLVGSATLFANGTPLGSGNLDNNLLVALTYNVLQFGVPCVLLLRLADAAVDGRLLPASLAYGAVVLLTVGLGVWVVAPVLYPLLGKAPWWTSVNDWILASTTLMWHGLGVSVYAQMRLSAQAQTRLLAAQGAHAHHQRELAAAQLLALQARMDPALLFDSLQHIDVELQTSPHHARARLAALIDLLRALQPHLDAKVSRLPREMDALRAYARLVGQDAQHTERLHLVAPIAKPQPDAADGHASPEWPDWPLAPMVLLPLLRPLLAAPQTIWSLEVAPAASGFGRLWLSALGPATEPTQAAAHTVPLVELARRLQAVHGSSARIELGVSSGLPRFELRWPLPAPPPAPRNLALSP